MENGEPTGNDSSTLRVVRRRFQFVQRRFTAGSILDGPAGVVAVVSFAVYFHQLGERPLWWWDESFYASGARNAIEHGYWLIPHVAGFDELRMYPFLEKPPLAIWLEAVSIGVFGPTEFAVRVPSAAAAVGTTVLVYTVARRIDGPTAGVVAATVFLTTPAVIVGPNGARFGATDTLHTLFGSALVAIVWLRATDRAAVSPLVTGVTLSALLLTKGFASGVFLLVAAPLVALRMDEFDRRFVAITGLTTAVLVGGWAVAAYLIEGQSLVQELVIEQVLRRLTGEMATIDYETVVPFLKYPYPTVAQVWFWPWWFLFLAGTAVTTVRTWVERGRPAPVSDRIDALLPLWWAGAVFVPFAMTGTVPWYIIPMYVPAAILIGRLVTDAVAGTPASVAGLVTGTALVVVAGVDRLLYKPGPAGGFALDPDIDPAWTAVLAVAVLLVGCWLLTTVNLERGAVAVYHDWSLDVGKFARLAVAGGSMALMVGILVGTPSVYAAHTDATLHHIGDETAEIDASMRHLGERTNRIVPAGEPVYVQPNAEARWFYSGYAFYANRPLRDVTVERLRTDANVRYAVVTTSGQDIVEDRHPTVIARSSYIDLVLVRLGPVAES